MISAWARMCKIIGQAFVQYLPLVMGPLLLAASIKPEIAIVDCELPWQCGGWMFVCLSCHGNVVGGCLCV